MYRINFNNTEPDFDNGEFKWYFDKHFQSIIQNEQAENLPKLKGLGCFVVKSKDVEDYVLIDSKQNIIASYPYTTYGHEQMDSRIKIIKISKHFAECESR
jgi:hypothetical protein